jgi:hypothetical protein
LWRQPIKAPGLQQKRLSKRMESLTRRERRGSLPRVTSRHNHILAGKGRDGDRAVSETGRFSISDDYRGCGYDTCIICACQIAAGCGRCPPAENDPDRSSSRLIWLCFCLVPRSNCTQHLSADLRDYIGLSRIPPAYSFFASELVLTWRISRRKSPSPRWMSKVASTASCRYSCRARSCSIGCCPRSNHTCGSRLFSLRRTLLLFFRPQYFSPHSSGLYLIVVPTKPV